MKSLEKISAAKFCALNKQDLLNTLGGQSDAWTMSKCTTSTSPQTSGSCGDYRTTYEFDGGCTLSDYSTSGDLYCA